MFRRGSRSEIGEVAPSEAHERVRSDGGALVDVREPGEWRTVRAAGARHIPLGELAHRAEELPKDRPIYLICASGNRSMVAAEMLRRAGFAQPLNVSGGTGAWIRSGLPVERG